MTHMDTEIEYSRSGKEIHRREEDGSLASHDAFESRVCLDPGRIPGQELSDRCEQEELKRSPFLKSLREWMSVNFDAGNRVKRSFR